MYYGDLAVIQHASESPTSWNVHNDQRIHWIRSILGSHSTTLVDSPREVQTSVPIHHDLHRYSPLVRL